MTATARHRLRPDAIRTEARRLNRRFALTVLSVALLVLGAYWSGMREGGDRPGPLVLGFGLLIALAGASYLRRMRRFQARWSSFEIVVDDDAVVRELGGVAPVRVARADVARLEESAAGLAVRDRAGKGLLVPRQLEGYDDVRARLAAWAPIAEAAPARRR